jgi:hypothetical protein
MLTQARLKQLMHYDPETGVFTRRLDLGGRGARVGTVSGFLNRDGYLDTSVGSRTYRTHRLAYLYMTGAWPAADIDHINLNRADNRWCNLREATRSRNNANTRKPSNNTSGYKGVNWHVKSRKWVSLSTAAKSI